MADLYYVYWYGFVVEDGGYQVGRGDWPTQAPIISPGFNTPEEAWNWLDQAREVERQARADEE